MSDPQIRLAEPSDAPSLATLRYAFRAAERAPVEPEDDFVARATVWMYERLSAERWRCWVAESDAGELLGHLWLQLVEKIPNPGPELESLAYITNVYVRPAARGGGLGGRLVEAAMTFCREVPVDCAVLWPTRRSRTLYARYGFNPPTDMLEAMIDDARAAH